ncbi:MAG: hypothetical protein O9293_09805 [Porphyrobacter sp.]|nr:hypothetical protein [Porphyrobacter sp.]
MSEEYCKPVIDSLAFDFDDVRLAPHQNSIALSGKDVLGIVQSALDELGAPTEEVIAVKREVLGQVSEGKLAQALRTAIVGAGKAGCTCCAT